MKQNDGLGNSLSQRAGCGHKVARLLCGNLGQHYLTDQLESFSMQTQPSWEVWPSDNCARDDSHLLLQTYQSNWGDGRLHVRSIGKCFSRWGCVTKHPITHVDEQNPKTVHACLQCDYPGIEQLGQSAAAQIRWDDEVALVNIDVRARKRH